MENRILLKQIFFNKYFNQIGIKISGDRETGKSFHLTLEAHINKGIIVTPNADIIELILEGLKISEPKLQIMTYKEFATSGQFGLGMNKPIYIDELDLFSQTYKIPRNAYKYICGYSTHIGADLTELINN